MAQKASTGTQALPFVDALLLLLVWLNKPLADADEAAIHEAALQQVVDGFEQERPALVGQAAFPLAVLLAWRKTSESALSSETLTRQKYKYRLCVCAVALKQDHLVQFRIINALLCVNASALTNAITAG